MSIIPSVTLISIDRWIHSIVFSSDGNYIATGCDDGTARVWETKTGKEITRMIHDQSVYSVAFSSDGKYVVSGSYDGALISGMRKVDEKLPE